jgi:predicted O-linked N-acetylglucosamine transferase (SPINDLY family)
MRSAPVQVNYLGYPGTTGAGYIDYLIADRTLIAQEHIRHYAEKIAFLPHTYQVNDSLRKISDETPSRRDAGLPQGFVFCCFNNNAKITPDVFDIWMRLLRNVEGSVLWLLEDNPSAARNLRREAVERGVPADRLVFARRMDLPDHLARHRLADLFLDTLYYNAHTTTSDALWAGLPVVTCLGATFAGRVAASLLNAIGLPELVAQSRDEYAALALRLAVDPQRLSAIRQKMARNRNTHPLFNTRLFAGHIESAYAAMWERHQAGLPPDHIHVSSKAR